MSEQDSTNAVPPSQFSPDVIARFWSKVRKPKADKCWVWRGARDYAGYGKMGVNRKSQSAHRLSYAMTYGPIPAGLFVCHHCDNKACVRPDHLFLGTHRDNVLDFVNKQRLRAGRPLLESSPPIPNKDL